MEESRGIKVIIRSPDGRYVSGHQEAWSLTPDSSKARVFDFVADHIAEQLESLRHSHGPTWVAVPVDPRERYEICDLCGQRVMAPKIFFDGRQFLCFECKGKRNA